MVKITRNQQKNKYETDKRYGSDSDDFDNVYSLRNYHGLYYETKRIKEIFKMFNKHNILFSNKKILEIGCNYGLYSNIFSYLKRTTSEIYGIDFINKYIKTASKINKNINFKQHDLYDELPFENNYMDILFCCYVLNCFNEKDLPKITSNMNSKVKSGGYILVFDAKENKFIQKIHAALSFKKYSKYKAETRVGLSDKYINKYFKNFEIIDKKSILPIFWSEMLLKLKLPYLLIDLFELIFPKSFNLYLLKKK